MADCVVGICAAIERVRWGPWEAETAMMPITYIGAVQDAGGLVLLLPPDDAVAGAPDQLLERVDALVLAGGADLDPASYGADPHPEIGDTYPARDRFELGVTRGALERGMPVLGICRGMELLNVALGGTLIPHLPDVVGHDEHRHMPGTFKDHDVRLDTGSLAARAAGAELVTVQSHHHQGVDQLGEGLVASGWSTQDEVIEAIEIPDREFALGVLWHPEEDERNKLLSAFVDAASAKVHAG